MAHFQGWLAALLVFWLIVVFVTPPAFQEHEPAARRSWSAEEIRPAKRTDDSPSVDVDGDAVVICDLDTPFADDGMSRAARGQLKIAVHRRQVGAGVDFELLSNSLTCGCRNPQLPQAPLASGAFLDMVRRKQ